MHTAQRSENEPGTLGAVGVTRLVGFGDVRTRCTRQILHLTTVSYAPDPAKTPSVSASDYEFDNYNIDGEHGYIHLRFRWWSS
jgi:hypothetical protein